MLLRRGIFTCAAAELSMGSICSRMWLKFRKMASVGSFVALPVALPKDHGRRSLNGSECTRKTLESEQDWIQPVR